jgi:hypothetical protein
MSHRLTLNLLGYSWALEPQFLCLVPAAGQNFELALYKGCRGLNLKLVTRVNVLGCSG